MAGRTGGRSARGRTGAGQSVCVLGEEEKRTWTEVDGSGAEMTCSCASCEDCAAPMVRVSFEQERNRWSVKVVEGVDPPLLKTSSNGI